MPWFRRTTPSVDHGAQRSAPWGQHANGDDLTPGERVSGAVYGRERTQVGILFASKLRTIPVFAVSSQGQLPILSFLISRMQPLPSGCSKE